MLLEGTTLAVEHQCSVGKGSRDLQFPSLVVHVQRVKLCFCMGWEELRVARHELWLFSEKSHPQPEPNHPISTFLCLQPPRGCCGMCPARAVGAKPALNPLGVFWALETRLFKPLGVFCGEQQFLTLNVKILVNEIK